MKGLVVVVLLFTCLLITGVSAQTTSEEPVFIYASEQRDTLKGLTCFRVYAELCGAADDTGITEDQLLNHIEAQLRIAGIQVYDDPSRYDFNYADLYATVQVLELGELNSYCISYSLAVHQHAIINRYSPDGSIVIRGVMGTWETKFLGYAPRADIKRQARETFTEAMTVLINDYLAVNPKEG